MKQHKTLAELQLTAAEQLAGLYMWAAQTNQVLPRPPVVLAGAMAKLRWLVANLTREQRAAFLAPARERVAANLRQRVAEAMSKALAPLVGQPASPSRGLRLVTREPADR